MTGQLLKLAYQLQRHYLGGWTLDRWGITLTWGAAALILVSWLLRGQPAVLAWHWAVLTLLVLTGGGLIALRTWAARRSFVVFKPEPRLSAPAAKRLDPIDKVRVHATGRFEVEGRSDFFADLLGYWRTFASREHTVMAIAHRSRFLGIGRMPPEQVGMWYIFFRPEVIEAIAPGHLLFGKKQNPALRVMYQGTVLPNEGSRSSRGKPVQETVYLAFEDEAHRTQVWGDLIAGEG